MDPNWQSIGEHIGSVTGTSFQVDGERTVGGGCINSARVLEDGDRCYFVKFNRAGLIDMFEAEFEGLAEMAAADSIRVPEPVCTGISGTNAYIVMEHLSLGSGGSQSQAVLGEQLADMHRMSRDGFGWHRNNTIGSTPQDNESHAGWIEFWQQCRLGPQLDLASGNGAGRRLVDSGHRLLQAIPALFSDYKPVPSLLHGDLWSGNYSVMASGEPVIFDPAVYYGDREADIAMTELFGGFSNDFYAAYREAWPLDPGYHVRKTLYNLYHILNHFNLFGGGYLSQAETMIDQLLGECR